MRRILLTLIAIQALSASAYDFMANGLAYNITSNNSVEVTYQNWNFLYEGAYSYPSLQNDMTISSLVTYGDKTYSVTSIGNNAFYGCGWLTTVTIPNSVTSIGNSAFYGCSKLTSITIPNSVSSIGNYTFQNCTKMISVTIPNSVTTIGQNVFRNCSGLTSVTIPNSVTSIGESAFYGCGGLISITIPNSITSIGQIAFSGCSALTSITIGNSVASIGSSAFYGCSSLIEIRSKIADLNIVSMGNNVFYNVPTSSCKLKVPIGTTDTYRTAYQWKDFSNIKEVLVSSGTFGDLNCDNAVDGSDINIMVNQLLKKTYYEDEDRITDLTSDGKVNGIDLHRIISLVLEQ